MAPGKASHDAVCQRDRDGHYRGGHPLSAYRGGFLLRNRLFISAVWLVQGLGKTGHVRGSHGHLAGNAGGSGVCSFFCARGWSGGTMVGRADRVDSGGCGGPDFLYTMQEEIIELVIE